MHTSNGVGQINKHPRANAVISAIDEAGFLACKRAWHDYHQSEVEIIFFRYKKLIGDERRARVDEFWKIEPVID